MAKRNRDFDEGKIGRFVKAGRGSGYGAEYQPFLQIHDVPSRGTSVRIWGWHTNRVHHALSQLEYFAFLMLEANPDVSDIREQWPLDRNATRDLASVLGVQHPRYPYNNVDVIMTTDFYVTFNQDNREWYGAYAVKYSADLENPRVIEKLSIERAYWKARGVVWRIITEREISHDLIFNMKLLHARKAPTGLGVDETVIQSIKTYIIPLLSNPQLRLRDAVNQCDGHFDLPPNRSMKILLHLIASRQLDVDLTKRIDPYQPLTLKKSSKG